jgi:hypothetical protein
MDSTDPQPWSGIKIDNFRYLALASLKRVFRENYPELAKHSLAMARRPQISLGVVRPLPVLFREEGDESPFTDDELRESEERSQRFDFLIAYYPELRKKIITKFSITFEQLDALETWNDALKLISTRLKNALDDMDQQLVAMQMPMLSEIQR